MTVLPAPHLESAPVVAHVVRSGVVESVHRGIAVVTSANGGVDFAVGDPQAWVYPRSATKPLQLLAMLRHGLASRDELVALGMSSHSGEPWHLDGVRRILAGAGLSLRDLQNTPDYPLDEAARVAWIGAGGGKESLTQNCSGKHSSMLATCVVNGWDTATYRDQGHPLQRAVTEVVQELCGPVRSIAVDGCGAPAHNVALAGLARAFGHLASSDAEPERRLVAAAGEHPAYLGGTGRDVSALVAGLPGCIAKDGAEAVYAVGLPDGRGVAVKIADGTSRARAVVMAAVLRRIGIDLPPVLEVLEHQPVLGHGQPVGSVVAVGI